MTYNIRKNISKGKSSRYLDNSGRSFLMTKAAPENVVLNASQNMQSPAQQLDG